MRYVAKETREDGCIFCNRLAAEDDARTLILYRGERAFVIMNLFPYNTGHVMIVPNAHVASLEDADPETMAEMAAIRTPVLRALRRALACEGFNLGLNIGEVAGAGVTDHLHEHVVPRWQGDANFMPILAATMVMPEMIPVTYGKLRAEIGRETGGGDTIKTIVVSADGRSVLLDASDAIPTTTAEPGEALWHAAIRGARDLGARDIEVIGASGSPRADAGQTSLVLQAHLPADDVRLGGHHIEPVAALLRGADSQTIRDALARIDESV